MKILDLNGLKARTQSVVSEELLNSISGGIQNRCHYEPPVDFNDIIIIK